MAALDWLLWPAIQGGLQALGIALCLGLFLSLKREARAAQLQASAREEAFQASLAALRETLEQVRSNLREVEERASTLVAPPPPPSGLNFSKRSHALRMCRRGETPERIAASLALPRREVELLVKIHQLLSKP